MKSVWLGVLPRLKQKHVAADAATLTLKKKVWLQMLPRFRAAASAELIKATRAQLHDYSTQARFCMGRVLYQRHHARSHDLLVTYVP